MVNGCNNLILCGCHCVQVDGDQILEVCEEVIPDRISEVILFSRLQTYNPEIALKILQSQMKHRSSIDEKHRYCYLYRT